MRRTGAAALDLAWTAAGRFDAYWEYGIKPWDMAAGIVLLREAGGFVSDTDGGTDMIGTGNIIAANDKIRKLILAQIETARTVKA